MTSAFRTVSINDLALDHKHWQNPRTFTGLSDPEIAELGIDIKARGILDAPMVQQVKTASGGITDLVIDGQRRVLAGLEVLPKGTKILVQDRTTEAIELTPEIADKIMFDMLAVGQKREGLSSFELSEVAERLRKRDRTLFDIANAIGKSESWVSKFLKARSTASPKLMLQWRKGQITDEQFKDLAEVKDLEKQAEATKEVVETRKSGDKAEARIRAKEITETAKNATKVNGVHKPKPTSVTQADLPHTQAATPVAPKRAPMVSRLVLDDVVAMAAKRPPTDPYVKGILHGVAYANGDLDMKEFAKPWRTYLARVEGSGKPKKAAKKERKAGGKARRGGKAKTKKGGRR